MQNFKDQFYLNFIKDDRWQYLTDGLKTTLLITFFAVILGLVLDFWRPSSVPARCGAESESRRT